MPTVPKIKPEEADLAYAAAQKVVEIHRRLAEFLERGLTLGKIDAFVGRSLEDLGCSSCFQGYRPAGMPPFPSFSCLSVNECIVHGTAGSLERPLEEGDVLKIDIGVKHRGWIGDAAWTYVFGRPAPEIAKLCESGKVGLTRAIKELRPGNTYMAWAQTLQSCVEGEYGLHLVRGLGGHGYGKRLHAPPFISNVVPRHPHEWPDGNRECQPGVLIAVEPMIAIGTGDTSQKSRSWPIYTADGSMSVHYEHDILITESGPRVLTEGLDELPDIITR